MRIAWIATATLTVFVLWLVVGSGNNPGIGFFYAVPIGLATWWFGRRAGGVTALACCCLYVVGALVEPVANVGLALALWALAFGLVVVAVSVLRERLIALEHAAEELEDVRAALTARPDELKPELAQTSCAQAALTHGVPTDAG